MFLMRTYDPITVLLSLFARVHGGFCIEPPCFGRHFNLVWKARMYKCQLGAWGARRGFITCLVARPHRAIGSPSWLSHSPVARSTGKLIKRGNPHKGLDLEWSAPRQTSDCYYCEVPCILRTWEALPPACLKKYLPGVTIAGRKQLWYAGKGGGSTGSGMHTFCVKQLNFTSLDCIWKATAALGAAQRQWYTVSGCFYMIILWWMGWPFFLSKPPDLNLKVVKSVNLKLTNLLDAWKPLCFTIRSQRWVSPKFGWSKPANQQCLHCCPSCSEWLKCNHIMKGHGVYKNNIHLSFSVFVVWLRNLGVGGAWVWLVLCCSFWYLPQTW